ncbi:TetR family transcriptional regulator [Thioalkalivibrio denitrificans]|uniref:TetR family transcriptional regulator n=1 Tax=Thioalkalivibrio denitrificans TaxID=108003 RepID=A0A1V3NFF3_9GAMM|nr:TetR/AcrR family transcriptional regulator [Thioalkalivibrio denitrificans]OOG23790.1 TetR family transcriptional regulator [Thioalkalivibrio denitrificans]
MTEAIANNTSADAVGRGAENRERIVAAADRLFYERGFQATSFSDIADAAGVPKGNFYYYFKTKDALLEGVIDWRRNCLKALLDNLNRTYDNPRERLMALLQGLCAGEDDIVRYGCPMGTLSAELCKSGHPLRERAQALLEMIRDWIATQLQLMGQDDPLELAREIQTRSQGVTLLAHAYGDHGMLSEGMARVRRWVESVLDGRSH